MSSLVSTTPLRQVSTVKEMLANKHACDQLASVAAVHLNPERMLRTLALSVSRTPKLAECTPLSLLGALMTSASLGLEANTPLGHAYLVPYGKDAQLVVGYRGYIQLAHNSRQIASLDAAVHYESDPVWNWRRGSNAVLDHETGDETGEMLHTYAIAEIKDGGKIWVVWPEAKLVAHRDRYSQGYKADVKRGKKPTDANVNIWLSQPDLARMKTMVRQISKWIPQATQIPMAAALDGARANYAQFAMDPSAGAPEIEVRGDGEAMGNEIEGAAVESEEGEQQGGGEPTQEKLAPVETKPAAAEPAATKPDAKAAADAAREKARAAAGTAGASTKAAPNIYLEMAANIRNSMLDLAPARAEEVLDVYAPEALENFKQHAPELFAEVMADISARENEAE